MLQVERSAWIACKQKEKQLALPGANKDKFEAEIEQLMDMSGAVPMYLNQFCDAFVKAKPGEFQMQQAMSTYAAESLAPVVDGNLVEFARSLLEKGSERFFDLAELFLRNDIVPSDTKIIDHRYFYVMPAAASDAFRASGHGYAVCAIHHRG